MIEKKRGGAPGIDHLDGRDQVQRGEGDDRHDHGLRHAVEIEPPARRCDRDHDDEDEIGGRGVDDDDSEQRDAEPDGGVVAHERERERAHERRSGEDDEAEREGRLPGERDGEDEREPGGGQNSSRRRGERPEESRTARRRAMASAFMAVASRSAQPAESPRTGRQSTGRRPSGEATASRSSRSTSRRGNRLVPAGEGQQGARARLERIQAPCVLEVSYEQQSDVPPADRRPRAARWEYQSVGARSSARRKAPLARSRSPRRRARTPATTSGSPLRTLSRRARSSRSNAAAGSCLQVRTAASTSRAASQGSA